MNADLRDWLLSDEAVAVIAGAAGDETPASVERVRREIGGPEAALRAAAALDLVSLRRRAAAKFARAGELFLTAKSFEQATDEAVARYKAARFVDFHAPIDVGCATGGDLLALAEASGRAIGYEAEVTLAAFARRNAEVLGVAATVHAERFDGPPAGAVWHADPDRRVGGRRSVRPESHEPSLATLAAWRATAPDAAIKLAPAAQLPADWQSECELEWISRAGECRQLVVWSGSLRQRPGQRVATRVVSEIGEVRPRAVSFAGVAETRAPVGAGVGDALYEPDPAVLAAGLSGALADDRGLAGIAPRIAYLTGGSGLGGALLAEFRVREVMPLDRKRLAGWLADRRVGRLEIKCRGVDLRPEELRKQLRSGRNGPKGDAAATLLVWRDGDRRVRVAITDRVQGPATP
ncbi:MAG: hypothetical protein AAF805_13465 [Planctomycetota bacterium]